MKTRYFLTALFMMIIFGDVAFSEIKRDANTINSIAAYKSAHNFIAFRQDVKLDVKNIFKDYKKEFGLRDLDKMSLNRVEPDKIGFAHYRFRQYYNNIPVEGAEFILHTRDGALKTGNGHIVRNINMATSPSIGKEQALEEAMIYLGAKEYMWESEGAEELLRRVKKDNNATYYPDPELVIVGPTISPELEGNKLAYKLDLYATNPYSYKTYYVDAHTGNVLLTIDKIFNGNQPGIAKTMFHDTVNIVTDHFPGGFRLREIRNGVSIVTYDANNLMNATNISDFTDTDNFWNNVNGRLDQSAPDAHWGTEMTFDYYLNVHDRNSIDDNGMELISMVHVGQNWSNASWNGVYMSYGDGNNSPFSKIAIVGHELSHGVTQYTAGLIYAYESGALNESFSDIFGVSIMYHAGVKNEDGSMVWDIVSRNLADPLKSGQADTYLGDKWRTGSGDNGGVHSNSQVQNHWYYMLVEGDAGVNSNGQEYEVTGIGLEKAEQIAYRTLVYYLTPSSGYWDARNASLQAAEDIFGICSEEYKQVANAWYAAGVGTPLHKEDIGVAAIISPETSCNMLSKNEKIEFGIKYYGACSTLPAGTAIPVSLSINEKDTITETFTTSAALESGDVTTFTFAATADMSDQATYNINCWTELNNDSNVVNNGFTKTVASGQNYSESNDLSIYELLSPKSSCEALPEAEKVKVKIFNSGCDAIPAGTKLTFIYKLNDGDPVSEALELSEAIPGHDYYDYAFTSELDLSVEQLYDLSVEVQFDDDPKPGNNSDTYQIMSGKIAEFPYLEGYEDGPAGWTSRALSNYNDWEWGEPKQKLINKAAGGTKAWMTGLNSNHSDMSTMVLESPCFDFSDIKHPNICFDLIFSFEVSYDGVILEYSTDNANWEKVDLPGYNSDLSMNGNLGIPWFTGTNSRWTNYCAYMPDLAGAEMVRFRFKVASDPHKTDEGVAMDNFEIKEMPMKDIELSSLISPITSCSLGKNEQVQIELTNYGIETVLTFDIKYNIDGGSDITKTIEDTIEYGASKIYAFDETANLAYLDKVFKFNVSVELQDDENLLNNELTDIEVINKKQSAIPLKESFESGSIPDYWTKSQNNGEGWIISDAATENAREGTESFQIPDHTRFAVANDAAAAADRRQDYLMLPLMNFENEDLIMIEFDAYFNDESDAKAYVEISGDMGETWTVVDSVPSKSKWQRVRSDLSDFAGESCVMLAFHYNDQAKISFGVAVDNINVNTHPNSDIALRKLYTDGENCYDKDKEISLEIENIGVNPIDKFNAVYYYSDGKDIDEKITENVDIEIMPGEMMTYSFKEKADMKALGSYSLGAYLDMQGDAGRFNDSLSAVQLNNSGIFNEFPYKEEFTDFTKGTPGILLNGWENDYQNDDIDWFVNKGSTTTGYTGPTRDHTGSNGIYMYVESSAPNFEKLAILRSPCFDISAMKIPYMSFWYHMQSNSPYTGNTMGELAIDVYDGEWHENVWTLSGNQGTQWKQAKVNLSEYIGVVKVRFRFLTGPGQTSDVAIDDIEIYEEDKYVDLGIIQLPKNGCGMIDGTDIGITIANNGTQAVPAGADVTFILDDDEDTKITETIPTEIPYGETYRHTFKKLVELSKGSHYFDFFISTPGDMNASNDTVRNHRVISYTNVFNFDKMTDCEGNTAVIPATNISGYDELYWLNDSTTGRTYYADTSGIYVVAFTFENGCVLYDSVEVVINPAPTTGLEDMLIPGPKEIDAGEFTSYLWNDSTVERTFYIDDEGTFWVTVSDEKGCYGTDAFDVEFGVSVNELPDGALKIFPNPTSGILELNITNENSNEMAVEICDLEGKRAYYKYLGYSAEASERIDISSLNSGAYFVKIYCGKLIKVRKIILER